MVARSDCPLNILPGEVPGWSVVDAVALRQPTFDKGLALSQQKKLLSLGAWNLVVAQKDLDLLCLHLQKELMVSFHHALIFSLHLKCPRGLSQKMPPKNCLKDIPHIRASLQLGLSTFHCYMYCKTVPCLQNSS